jgi:predicted dehydrogenase
LIRIGLIGCGEVAGFGHLPAIVKSDEFELVALFDPVPSHLEAMATRFEGAKIFTSIEEFYESRLDAVAITSPAPSHHDHVLRAAKQKVHVLCEKPISEDEGEAVEMAKAMEATGKVFTIGFCYRFSFVTSQIKTWVDTGVVGAVKSLRLTYIWNLHGRYEEAEDGSWHESARWRGRMIEGGPMVDCGVHSIDLARHWLGSEIVRHTAAGAWVADYEAPDHMWLHLDHESGAHTAVEMSFTYGHTAKEPINFFSYHLIGDGGVIRYDREGYVLEARNGQGTIRAPGSSEKNFEGMYAAFAKAIKTGDSSKLPNARDGIVATQIARSATNRVIAERMKNSAL